MNNNSKKIESFTDLNAWKEAHKLALMICKITYTTYKLLNSLIKNQKNIPNSKFQIPNSNGGFTLIEMIAAVSIFAIMMMAITSLFVTLYKEQGGDIARIQSVETAGRAIDRINGEIRKMSRAENGSSALSAAEAQRLVFYSDVDNDDLTEKIEYVLNGTDLRRSLTEPGAALDYSDAPIPSVVASDIVNGANPVFRYYDENYTGTEPPLANPVNVTMVRIIEINLDINTDPARLPAPVHIETKIQPRNLKSYD